MGQVLLHSFDIQHYEYKVNGSLKAIFSKLRHVDIEQMETKASNSRNKGRSFFG